MYYRERRIGHIKSNHHHSALTGLENKTTQPATSFSQPHEKVSRQLNCSTAVFCIYYYYYSLKPMAEDSAIKLLQKCFTREHRHVKLHLHKRHVAVQGRSSVHISDAHAYNLCISQLLFFLVFFSCAPPNGVLRLPLDRLHSMVCRRLPPYKWICHMQQTKLTASRKQVINTNH